MKADCHIHMVLDGVDWKASIARHRQKPDREVIRQALAVYRDRGYTYLRDGGDRWGVGKQARELAEEYGITYRTPLAPLCRIGHYGSFIGRTYENMNEYAALVAEQKAAGADFVKIMISGLMDFHRFGVLSEPALNDGEIRELIHIAHEEGMAVMAHANGNSAVVAAAQAGLDSVEHGAYLEQEALCAMKENGTVWVPTLSTIGNLLGKGRFPDAEVERILQSALANVEAFARMGGSLASGTDAGAWAVPHGCGTEEDYFAMAGIGKEQLEHGAERIMKKF